MDQAAVKKRVVGVDISLEETTYAVVDAKGDIFAKMSFIRSMIQLYKQ